MNSGLRCVVMPRTAFGVMTCVMGFVFGLFGLVVTDAVYKPE